MKALVLALALVTSSSVLAADNIVEDSEFLARAHMMCEGLSDLAGFNSDISKLHKLNSFQYVRNTWLAMDDEVKSSFDDEMDYLKILRIHHLALNQGIITASRWNEAKGKILYADYCSRSKLIYSVEQF